MWLWNKFKNTNIIGKIYILIILFIIVVAIITILTRYQNVNKDQTVDNPNIENDNKTDATSTSDMNIINGDVSTVSTLNQETKEEIIKNNQETKENITSNKNNTIPVAEKVVSQKSINIPTDTRNNKEEVKTENKVEKNTNEVTIKEEYKVNNEIINKMKNIIDSNVNEYMKEYGYDVIIDSSIMELTNQFTFTEKRVKDKITIKFGTIKIYAQDYYKNGQYMYTECYLI